MNVHTLIKKLEAGKITIDKCGHKIRDVYILNMLLERLKRKLVYHKERNGKYDKVCLEAMNDPQHYVPGNDVMEGFHANDFNCSLCGTIGLDLMFKDESTLQVVHYKDMSKPFLCDTMIGPHKTIIEVPSGKLLFANFFRAPDAPNDKEYTPEFDLGSLKGRRGIANYKASKGFGFGQMGNMCILVYINNDGDNIVIIDGFYENIEDEVLYFQENDLELPAHYTEIAEGFKALQKTHTCIGSLSLDVWRWECVDPSLLGNVEISEERLPEVAVKPGRWEITHNYDCYPRNFIASELKLIRG